MLKYELRAAKILKCKIIPEVSDKYLQAYRKYLIDHLSPGIALKGREDFLWEEYYLIGPGEKSEYELLKQSNPSYKDDFILLKILSKTADKDLIAVVKRISDGKKFQIGLSWLTTRSKRDEDYQLLNDFASWVVNC